MTMNKLLKITTDKSVDFLTYPTCHHTPLRFRRQTNYYEQIMLKHPLPSPFHSLAEYLHAGLLEADPAVQSYVPQPYQFNINGKRYVPDIFVVRGNQKIVMELKPESKLPFHYEQYLVPFLQKYHIRFEVITNESVLAQEQKALNWLKIVRVLVAAQQNRIRTSQLQDEIISMLASSDEGMELGDLIDSGDRQRTYTMEIAVFRLAYAGLISLTLDRAPLDFDTVITL
ncbi:hypothetical protein [Kangiella aquimarina]|uniref:TnsA endonuclease N-terminal domain-containing protein n=1 Tax=Kangiella aquimarina TaxID=261965 RepID=A0ABZ0X296_9GAMM|nr:hypothetical protein [Kangiella aquimarina]WQG84432.1 hypothetical protein SR900_08135 [Kangiella aquimarina]